MEQLDWLPRHADLSAAIRAAKTEASIDERLAAACRLAGFRRDFLATDRIDRIATEALQRLQPGMEAALRFARKRIALLGSHTLAHLAPGIRVAGLARRLAIDVHVGDYNLYRHALLSGDVALADFHPDFVLLALDEAAVVPSFPPDATVSEVEMEVDREIDAIKQLWSCIRERYGAQPVQQTLLGVTPPVFGNYEALIPGSVGSAVDLFNARLRQAAREEKALLIDLAWEAGRGRLASEFVDPVRWYHAKQLVSPLFTPFYGDLVGRVVAAAAGISRKCLVLDLDNTLWGGVLGDDGIGGLRLGQGSADGEAYAAFQRYVARLGQRGVILAVCSKNDPALAERAFSSHPEMVLKKEDIAVFVANWDDKATNLRKIAKTLDIGVDSLVFVDDNPAEREIVRIELPEVAVPEMPDDVANYPRCLANAGYFETASFTAADVSRGRSYAARGRRLAELERTTDIDGYLRSLAMTMTVEFVGPDNIARVTQLINKTNQFNLTTRRHTADQVEHFASAPGNVALAFRLSDRLEDAGLIATIFAVPADAGEMYIDTWLMSCRVLGRQVEAASLQALVEVVSSLGGTTLIGEHIPTARNGMVANHYKTLGFAPTAPLATGKNGTTRWSLEIGASLPHHHIAVEIGKSVNQLFPSRELMRKMA
jgi:FkbH-like protein